MRLLFVHGIAQGGRSSDILRSEWLGALRKGLAKTGKVLPPNLEVDVPFYGDCLDEFVTKFKLGSDASLLPKGSPIRDEFDEFRTKVADEIRQQRGITPQQIRQEVPEGTTEKGVQNWDWVQAILRIVDRNFPVVTQGTLERFLQDVFLYTQRDVVRNAIDEIVTQELTSETVAVIGHSLGSVVAYNVLTQSKSIAPRFVTVGSPLGISTIRKTVVKPLCNPSGERGWYNFYDKNDVVSLYPLDSVHFGVTPSIDDNGTVANWTDNKHGIVGYLDNENVADAIYSGIQPPPRRVL